MVLRSSWLTHLGVRGSRTTHQDIRYGDNGIDSFRLLILMAGTLIETEAEHPGTRALRLLPLHKASDLFGGYRHSRRSQTSKVQLAKISAVEIQYCKVATVAITKLDFELVEVSLKGCVRNIPLRLGSETRKLKKLKRIVNAQFRRKKETARSKRILKSIMERSPICIFHVFSFNPAFGCIRP